VKNYNFNIAQNYPNPFNPSTTIFYSLKEGFDGNVKVIVYNSFGQIVKTLVNEKQKEGNYKVIFNADNFPSGVYYYGIEAGNYISKKKMTLVK